MVVPALELLIGKLIVTIIYLKVVWVSFYKQTLLRTVTYRYVWNSGESCKEDLDCGIDKWIKIKCINDKCVQHCEDSSDDNNHCQWQDHCVNNICIPRCKNNQDCPDGEFCARRGCIPGCGWIGGHQHLLSRECPEGTKCHHDYCSVPLGNHLWDCVIYFSMWHTVKLRAVDCLG